MPDSGLSRRAFLSTSLGTIAVAGCLQTSSSTTDQTTASETSPSTATTQEQTATQTAGQTTAAPSVTVEERRAFSDYVLRASTAGGHYYMSTVNNLQRVRPTGETIWNAKPPADETYEVNSAALHVDDTHVYAPYKGGDDTPGLVSAVDRESGKEQWRFTAAQDGLHNNANGLARLDGETLAIASTNYGGSNDDPHIYGVDVATGEEQWRLTGLPSNPIQQAFQYNGTLYVVANKVYRCLPSDGTVEAISEWLSGTRETVADGVYYNRSMELEAFDIAGETITWTTELSGKPTAPVSVGSTRLFTGTETGFVYALQKDTGEKLWENRVISRVYSVAQAGGLLWVCDRENLYALDPDDGTKRFEQEFPEARGLTSLDSTLLVRATTAKLVHATTSTA